MGLQRKRLANAERVKELVDSAFASRYHDLATTLRLSSAAVALAEETSQELPPDLMVAAWTQYGNALRIAGRYPEAERALNRAAELPATDPSTKANLLEVRASLHRNLDRYESAAQFLTAAIDEHRATGDPLGEARTLNLLGIVYRDAADHPSAFRAFKAALELLGPDSPVDAVAMTGHNLMETLIDDGRLSAASSALALLEPFYRRITSARLSAKAEWIRARLCRALEQFHAAQLAYERAYDLLRAESRFPDLPELPDLLQEMAELEALMGNTNRDSD